MGELELNVDSCRIVLFRCPLNLFAVDKSYYVPNSFPKLVCHCQIFFVFSRGGEARIQSIDILADLSILSIYILYPGLPILMESSEGKTVPYTVVGSSCRFAYKGLDLVYWRGYRSWRGSPGLFLVL